MKLELEDWAGGEMPVAKGTRVLVRHRDGKLHTARAGVNDDLDFEAEDWSHDNGPGDIVAWTLAESPSA